MKNNKKMVQCDGDYCHRLEHRSRAFKNGWTTSYIDGVGRPLKKAKNYCPDHKRKGDCR